MVFYTCGELVLRGVNPVLRNGQKHLWNDGIHLNDNGTFIFASNIVNFLNNFILNRNI